MTRTSETDPLRIDTFSLWNGRVGMTLCPGKTQPDGQSGSWSRQLAVDISAIDGWGATAVITLMEAHELDRLRVPELPDEMMENFPTWVQAPIRDRHAPDASFLKTWRYLRVYLAHHLLTQGSIALHCMGGLGRTGTVAAMLCKDAGMSTSEAIALVRQTRPGTIETLAQERFVENYEPEFTLTPETVRGALMIWAGAAGDALGYDVEFDRLTRIQQRYGRHGIHPSRLTTPPRVSDDTQMTLYALAALADTPAPTLDTLRRGWLHWYAGQAGLPDTASTPALQRLTRDEQVNQRQAPGGTCMSALADGGHGSMTQPINNSKGCGTVMRTAPIAMLPHAEIDELIELARAAAALTHGHRFAWDSAGLLTGALALRIRHRSDPVTACCHLIKKHPSLIEGYEDLLLRALDAGHPRPRAADYGEGWVAEEALAIGLACAQADLMQHLSHVMARAANHDGDSDSTAAIAAQLAGSIHLHDSDSVSLILRLDVFDAIADTLAAFYQTHH
ncbi:MAG: ADP-ribosylglycohydrolase family protein [Alcanivoracaceae bacterium]|jgi:ADP-ribosylglycohydrolase|nr:ADP-ribosylglycohydrolase family protein [Alcanivoracaceae bacterium]